MENQEINLAVAAIAGRTDNYVESIDAIWKVFESLDIKDYHVAECSANMELPYEASQSTFQEPVQCFVKTTELVRYGETPAIALCNLLLAINPTPIKPVKKAEVLEAV